MNTRMLSKDTGTKQGYRVLFISNMCDLWLSRNNKIFISSDYGRSLKLFAEFKLPFIENIFNQWRIYSRLTRSGFHDLAIMPTGRIVGIFHHHIVAYEEKSDEFITTFDIQRGSRPLSLAMTPDEKLYFGEYFSNERREDVHVYTSHDGGKQWNICYTFSKGSIRHIHNIIYDPYRKGLLILTGDEDKESYVFLTKDKFSTVEPILKNGQKARALTAIPIKEGIILPTDTPLEQNYIQFLDNSGKLHQLCPIPGSAFYSCRVGPYFFISTGVEPSRVNKLKYATIYASKNCFDWKCVFKAKKDILPSKLFQYGNIFFPKGLNNTGYLFFTTVALSGCDQVLHCWEVDDLLKRDAYEI